MRHRPCFWKVLWLQLQLMFSLVIINYKYNNYVYVLTVAGMCLLSYMHLNRNCFCSKEFVRQECHETKELRSSPSIIPLCLRDLRRREGKNSNTFLFWLSIASVFQRHTVITPACTLGLGVIFFLFYFPSSAKLEEDNDPKITTGFRNETYNRKRQDLNV